MNQKAVAKYSDASCIDIEAMRNWKMITDVIIYLIQLKNLMQNLDFVNILAIHLKAERKLLISQFIT